MQSKMETNQSQNQKKKFVCKFCNKRYPCGKSLGGHIRIHQNGNYSSAHYSAAEDDHHHHHSGSSSKKQDKDSFSADGYILRENPKKTRKFESDAANNNNPNGNLMIQVCKECGKGFQSLKALCGHMACHSRNYSFDEEDQSDDTSEKLMMKDLVMDDQSDTETSAAPSKRRRSKRMMRYKNIGTVTTTTATVHSSSASIVSDLEQDQEEVALCLMMLSKDSGLKGCNLSYVADSSDNNSVVLEAAKSTCLTKMRIKVKNNGRNGSSDCYDDNDENSFMEMKVVARKKHQQRQVVISSDNDAGYGSDSGYFNYGPKKVEEEPEVVSFHAKKPAKTSNYHKRARESSDENETTTVVTKKVVNKSYNNGKNQNHPPAGKSSKLSANAAGAKKAKVHECPFCSKVFRSGQALGGHKRSHFVGGAEDTTVVLKQQVADIPMIDLNLPAPVDHEEQPTGFVTW
ncbi:Zinc finger protein ZAT4 [Linum grandiflorum]